MSEIKAERSLRKLIIVLCVIALIFTVVILAAGYYAYDFYKGAINTTPLTVDKTGFVGTWKSGDEYMLQIKADGTGGYRYSEIYSTGASQKECVSGANVKIDDNKITLSFLWFDKEFNIKKLPVDGFMVLGKRGYTKQPEAGPDIECSDKKLKANSAN